MLTNCRTILRVLFPLLLLWIAATGHVSAQAIVDAVRRNDFAAVQRLLKENPRAVAITDSGGSTPLHWAANQGNLQIMQLLFDYRAGVNVRQHDGWTPMHSAAIGNQAAAMQMLWDHGADTDVHNTEGYAPIHIAARSNMTAAIVFLLSAGVDIDTKNGEGNTALAVAAANGQVDAGQNLIACGADLNVKNKDGETALDLATRNHKDEFVRMLAGYQQALDERAARDLGRKTSGLNLRTTYAAWLDHKAVTKTVYSQDFHGDRPGPEWKMQPGSGDALHISATPIGSRRFLGEFCNSAVVLTLADLPPHQEIAITFDLFMIRSMDGNLPNIGPDLWSLGVIDGPALLNTTFANLRNGISPRLKVQAYPGEYPGDHNQPYTGALENGTLGYKFQNDPVPSMDAMYRLRYTFSSSSQAILFRFAGGNLEGTDNETWGITNVQVAVGVTPAGMAAHPAAVNPGARPAPVRAATARAAPSHRIAPRRIAPSTRAVTRRPKPVSKPKAIPVVKRIHTKKVAPKP